MKPTHQQQCPQESTISPCFKLLLLFLTLVAYAIDFERRLCSHGTIARHMYFTNKPIIAIIILCK